MGIGWDSLVDPPFAGGRITIREKSPQPARIVEIWGGAVGRFAYRAGPRGGNPMPIQGQQLAEACAKAADEVKAEQIRIWDMRGVSNLTDFMVVCSASSMPQMRAILRDVAGKVEDEHGVRPVHSDGKADTRWVVIDYIDVMVHVMHQELRDYYGLEELWKDAREVPWQSHS
jgi:ribosome-associated protein